MTERCECGYEKREHLHCEDEHPTGRFGECWASLCTRFQPAEPPAGVEDGCVAQPTRAEFDAAMDNVRRTPEFREEYERLVLDETAQPEGCEHNDRAVLYCLRCGRIKGTIGRRMELVPADVVEAVKRLPDVLRRQAQDTEGGPGYQAIYATFMRAAAIAEEVLAMLPKEGE